MAAKRWGFGDVTADSARALERGKYPPEALNHRMTVKGLFQSDPHDARILKACTGRVPSPVFSSCGRSGSR